MLLFDSHGIIRTRVEFHRSTGPVEREFWNITIKKILSPGFLNENSKETSFEVFVRRSKWRKKTNFCLTNQGQPTRLLTGPRAIVI